MHTVEPVGGPDLDVLAEVADAALHPMVRSWRPREDRLAALREELTWSVEVASRDLDYARDFAIHQPASGAAPERFLDRWLAASPGLTVMCGPRYRGRDPDRPFVDVVASDRVLTVDDVPALRALARREFAEFRPGHLRLWTADPAGTWPGTGADMRTVAGPLGALRARPVPPELTVRPATDLAFLDRYAGIHREQVSRQPSHALHARTESVEDLRRLLAAGTLFEVLVHGRWAGVLAGEPGVVRGIRGATVVVLVLEHGARGRGYGRHLSALLSQNLPLPDDQLLVGTIHVDNTASLRSALGAGRVDVGGEVTVPLR